MLKYWEDGYLLLSGRAELDPRIVRLKSIGYLTILNFPEKLCPEDRIW